MNECKFCIQIENLTYSSHILTIPYLKNPVKEILFLKGFENESKQILEPSLMDYSQNPE